MPLRFSIANYYETYSENEELQKIDEFDVRRKPKSSIPPPLTIETPDYPRTPTPEHFTPAHDHIDEVRRERFYLSQPYRTTPLVLPGAKIKKDKPLGESYIRHHPNPKIRAPPQHYEIANPEVAFKQKVVHQQFHTGYCSEQDIEETVKCQASNIPFFVDFSFLKQKQEIEDQARRMREQAREAAAKNWAAKAY